MEFCRRYDHHFIGQGRNSVEHARHYITGLMGTQRSKNIETIENDVAGSDSSGHGAIHQLIALGSPGPAHDDVARNADEAIGDDVETGLFLDETSFLKKGESLRECPTPIVRAHREEEELHAQIEKRHAARQRDIDRRKHHKPGVKRPETNSTK